MFKLKLNKKIVFFKLEIALIQPISDLEHIFFKATPILNIILRFIDFFKVILVY